MKSVGCLTFSITNGTMLVPIQLAPKEVQGISFLVSFGIGALVVTPVFALVYFVAFRKKPDFKISVSSFRCAL